MSDDKPRCIACGTSGAPQIRISLYEQPPGDDLCIRNPVEVEGFHVCHRCHYEATKRMIVEFGRATFAQPWHGDHPANLPKGGASDE